MSKLAGLAVFLLALLAHGAGAQEAPVPPAEAAESGPAHEAAPAPSPPERFAAEITRFAEADALTPPPSCAFLFVGSSSIRFWKTLAQDMTPFPVINRGFGGAHVADVNHYFDAVVTPYHPRAIFFYAGENDLWAGQTPSQVVSDFERFMTLKTEKLGDTPVYFISLKPSKLRIGQIAEQGEVNSRIRALAEARADLEYIDVVPAMLEQNEPKDIYVADGLHMSPIGYALWTGVVRPVVAHASETGHACAASSIKATP